MKESFTKQVLLTGIMVGVVIVSLFIGLNHWFFYYVMIPMMIFNIAFLIKFYNYVDITAKEKEEDNENVT